MAKKKPPPTITTDTGAVWPLTRDGKLLVLRTCNKDLTSHGGFQWPGVGVECVAPDWDPDPTRPCGGGLHGLLWGVGDAGLLGVAMWLVVAVDPADVANLDAPGKVRFRAGTPVLITEVRDEATTYLYAQGAAGMAVVYGTSTSGDRGTSTSGNYGTSTSGDGGTSTSGDYGTSTSGYYGTSTSGYYGTSTSGDYGTSTSGDGGTSTSGDGGTSTSGDYGTSTSGDYGTSTSGDGGTSTSGDGGTSTSGYRGTSTSGDGGTSTSGDYGTSTSGDRGTSTSGDGGTSTSGDRGTLVLRWWDSANDRDRTAVAYVGEDGIKPNTPYRRNPVTGAIEEVK